MKTTRGHDAPAGGAWAWQHSLQYRILFAYGAVFLAALAVLLLWIGDTIYRADLDAGRHELEATAVLAANALEEPFDDYSEELEDYWDADGRRDADGEPDGAGDDDGTTAAQLQRRLDALLPGLQQAANDYAAGVLGRVMISDAYGRVLADSLAPVVLPLLPDQEPERPQLPAALQSGEGVALRPTAPEQLVPSLIVTAPVQQEEQLLGFVQISRPVDAITADVRGVQLRLALASLVVLAAAAALALWIGRRLVQPLRELEEAAFAVAEGDFTRTVAVRRDDELGALARAFNHMVGEVRSLLEQQRAFVANASHELRTPLTNIKLRSEALVALHGADPAREARYLAEIDAEADRLARLANDLLDLSRLEKAPPALPAEPIDIAPVLHKVVGVMQLRAEQGGLALRTAIAGDLAPVLVSAGDLEVIAANLLDNAIKYTQAGGTVQLAAGNVAGGNPAAGVEIRVQDNGPGIPPEDMPHIFERFYRVDKARSRRAGQANGAGPAPYAGPGYNAGSGAGLGLAIVRELVERNGGSIRVESTPGQGTVFLVSLPVRRHQSDRLA